MDRPTKRRRAPGDAPAAIKTDCDGKDADRPFAAMPPASTASLRGMDRSKMEAERLARLVKQKTRIPSATRSFSGMASAVSESYATWSKKWDAVYPPSLLREVGKRRNPSFLVKSDPTGSERLSQEPVYTVHYYISGGYGPKCAEVLGTYQNVASANEHAMVHFAREHREFGLEECLNDREKDLSFPKSKGRPDYNQAYWDMDKSGCLIFKAHMGKWGWLELKVLKQPVLREPPAFQPDQPTALLKPRVRVGERAVSVNSHLQKMR